MAIFIKFFRKFQIFSLILISSFNIFAQDDETFIDEVKEFTPSTFSYGFYAEAKASLNAGNVIDGRKHFVAISGIPDFGLTFKYLLSENYHLAINGEIGFNDYTYGIRIYKNNKEYEYSHSYINLASTFSFTYFNFGFGFGIPVSSHWDYEISTDKLNFLAEFKMGGEMPLFNDETGTLNLNLKIGYMLTGAFLDYGKDDPLAIDYPAIPPDVITNKYNPHPVSLSLGLSWLFNY